MFPFNRGLFEDKVANFWCASNVLIKWKKLLLPERLPKLATLLTLVGFLPSLSHMLIISWGLRESHPPGKQGSDSSSISPTSQPLQSSTQPLHSPISLPHVTHSSVVTPPTSNLLPYALFNSSMAFFLFSFQVHEKSILLPLMPLTLLMSGRSELDDSTDIWEWGALINNVGVFR